MTSAVNKRTKEYSWFSSVAIAGSVLLKQRSEKMDATASVLGILLKSKSVEASEVLWKLIYFFLIADSLKEILPDASTPMMVSKTLIVRLIHCH